MTTRSKNVADVVALAVEKAGMKNLDTTGSAFRVPPKTTLDEAAKLFGAFIRNNPIENEHALYAEFVGTPDGGRRRFEPLLSTEPGNACSSTARRRPIEVFNVPNQAIR